MSTPDHTANDHTRRRGSGSSPWTLLIGALAAVVLVAAGVGIGFALDDNGETTASPADRPGMGAMEPADDVPRVPPVFGYYGGEEIFFIHTEASDPDIAQILEGMMGSPVPTVPSLAEVPETARSPVYVFTNGLTPQDTPAGPLGFQPDVFAAAPGDDDYTPLRELVLVTWSNDTDARLLTTAEEVNEAEAAGDVTFERPGVVINIPLLTWPGGKR